jgi:hypothetical protein
VVSVKLSRRNGSAVWMVKTVTLAARSSNRAAEQDRGGSGAPSHAAQVSSSARVGRRSQAWISSVAMSGTPSLR